MDTGPLEPNIAVAEKFGYDFAMEILQRTIDWDDRLRNCSDAQLTPLLYNYLTACAQLRVWCENLPEEHDTHKAGMRWVERTSVEDFDTTEELKRFKAEMDTIGLKWQA